MFKIEHYIVLSRAPLFQPWIGMIWPFSYNYHQLLKIPVWANWHLQMYECPNIHKDTIHVTSFPESYPSQKVSFPRRSAFPGGHLYREITFTGRPTFPWSHLSRHLSQEFTVPRKSPFPESHLSREVKFPRKSPLSGSHISREVKFPGDSHKTNVQMSNCPNVHKIPSMSCRFKWPHELNGTVGRTYREFCNT